MRENTLVEICVDDVEGAVTAEQAGADRIELCAGLAEGGTTPSIGTVRRVFESVRSIDVAVMIRPRGGDFVHSPRELDVMTADIEAISALPRTPSVGLSFVFGALTPDDEVDAEAVAALVSACGPAPAVFHRAFDMTPDLGAALDVLLDRGVERVLTSGGASSAAQGAPVLRRLIDASAGRLTVVAGGSVRAENVAALIDATGVTDVHLRAMHPVPAGRPYGSDQSADSSRFRLATSYEAVAAVLRALGRDQG